MKFSEVKPFLMAGFKIVSDKCSCDLHFYHLKDNKIYHGNRESIFTLDTFDEGDCFTIKDIPDPKKLTRAQAEKLIDSGYKICSDIFNKYYWFKIHGRLHYGKVDGYYESQPFITGNYFYLYDNEPVNAIITKPYQYRTVRPLLREHNELKDKLETYWKELIYRNSVAAKMAGETLGQGYSCVIVDDIHKPKEPQMNQSFAKIKPFVLAGFKFNYIGSPHSFMQHHKYMRLYEETYYKWFLLQNQQSHARNLNYEQAQVLVFAGYKIKEILPFCRYELLDELPTTETTMYFDFKKAMDYLEEGNKITNDDFDNLYGYIVKDSDGDIVDKDGDSYDIDGELIFSKKWKLYEKKKLQVEIQGTSYACNGKTTEVRTIRLEKTSHLMDWFDIQVGPDVIGVVDNNDDILVKLFKDGKIYIDKEFIESKGYKLEVA